MSEKNSLLDDLVAAADDLLILSSYNDEARTARSLIYKLDVAWGDLTKGIPTEYLRNLPDGSLSRAEVWLLCDVIDKVRDL